MKIYDSQQKLVRELTYWYFQCDVIGHAGIVVTSHFSYSGFESLPGPVV